MCAGRQDVLALCLKPCCMASQNAHLVYQKTVAGSIYCYKMVSACLLALLVLVRLGRSSLGVVRRWRTALMHFFSGHHSTYSFHQTQPMLK